ncbi:MAG: hypothetical protein WBP86_05045 [Thiobacillaceae bacterium]
MVILRLLLVLTLGVVGSLVLAWVFTRERRYLDRAMRGLRFLFIFVLIAAMLYVIERLVLI